MNEYKSRARFEPSPMYQMAEAMTDEEIEEVSAWFAQLKPVSSSKVIEADSVIETKIHPRLMMRQAVPDGKMEALNGRLIEIPEDPHLVEMRDPRAGFVAFVPRGSIEKGKILATTGGGKTIVCSTCHGEGLKGTNEIPRLAGLSPDYLVRQLKAFKSGKRNGAQASQMTPSVQNLDESEMVAISAYLGSLKP